MAQWPSYFCTVSVVSTCGPTFTFAQGNLPVDDLAYILLGRPIECLSVGSVPGKVAILCGKRVNGVDLLSQNTP